MNTLIVLAAVIAAAAAVADPGAEVVSVQQDTLGNYNLFQLTHDGVSRVEQRNWPVTGYSHVVEPYPVLRSHVVAEHSLPVAKVESLPVLHNVELGHVPLTRTLEVPHLSYVKSPLVATTPLLRVGAVPESPEILDIESRQFAAHVAHQNYRHLI